MEKGLQIFDINQLKEINLEEYDFVALWTETCIFKVKFENSWLFLSSREIFKLRTILNWKKLIYITSLLPEYVEKNILFF